MLKKRAATRGVLAELRKHSDVEFEQWGVRQTAGDWAVGKGERKQLEVLPRPLVKALNEACGGVGFWAETQEPPKQSKCVLRGVRAQTVP